MRLLDKGFARLYPKIISGSEDKWLRAERAALLAQAHGAVVEIGAGAGHNLPHYPQAVTSLTLTEASPYMVEGLRREVERVRPDATVLQTPAESLPLPDDSADVVVSTLVLCTAPPDASLAEVRRILKPGGALLLIEHVAGTGKVARMQRIAQPFTRFCGRGCHVTRDTRAALERAGFDTGEVRDFWIDDEPSIYGPHIAGVARIHA